MRYYIVIVYYFLTAAAGLVLTGAGPAQAGEGSAKGSLKVSLFGQPCKIEGPLDTTVLKTIHAISPEQASPGFSAEDALKAATAQTLKSAIAKTSAVSKVPSALERYRDKLVKRLEAQAAFTAGVQAATRTHKPGSFLKAVQPSLHQKAPEKIEALAKKLETEKGEAAETVNQLYELFSDLIEPDPEEEFHRTIRKMGVNYICSFEENSAAPGAPHGPGSGEEDSGD